VVRTVEGAGSCFDRPLILSVLRSSLQHYLIVALTFVPVVRAVDVGVAPANAHCSGGIEATGTPNLSFRVGALGLRKFCEKILDPKLPQRCMMEWMDVT
jgi:hypothetical protein